MYVDISVYTCLATSTRRACAMFFITVAISATSSETIVSGLYYLHGGLKAMPNFAVHAAMSDETIDYEGNLQNGTMLVETHPGGCIYSQYFTKRPMGSTIPMPIEFPYDMPDIDLTMESTFDPETGRPPIGNAMRTSPTLYIYIYIYIYMWASPCLFLFRNLCSYFHMFCCCYMFWLIRYML